MRSNLNKTNVITIATPITYLQEVVGEASYQDSFEAICGKRKEEGENRIVEAAIVPEPNNPYDPNAFKVIVSGKIVGYLPRQFAEKLRNIYQRCGITDTTVLSVKGVIRGGWEKDGIKGHYGIWLELPPLEVLERQLKQIERKPREKKISPIFILLMIPLGLIYYFMLAGIIIGALSAILSLFG